MNLIIYLQIGVFLLGIGILNHFTWALGLSIPFLMIGLARYNYNQAKTENSLRSGWNEERRKDIKRSIRKRI